VSAQDHPLLEKFDLPRLEVERFDHWIVAVRAKQVTLGSAVILLRRAEPSLAGLTGEEANDLIKAVGWFESVTQRMFSPDRYNYVFAMMKDPFVHMHAFPRYQSARVAFGVSWYDEDWPRAATLRDVSTSAELLSSLVSDFRKADT
jgi:diadenosine tetraphosphate (Ap4A) HIT family hydrolase